MLSRRDLGKAAAGALVVLMERPAHPQDSAGTLNPSRLEAWLEIQSDGAVIARTGRGETGAGMSAFYAQVVAEELCVLPERVRLVMGDTDRTPDGGYSSGFLTGAANLRKVSAYAYRKLLELAAEHFQVETLRVSVVGGVVSAGPGRSISYGDLLRGRQLSLTIPIKGEAAHFAPDDKSSVAGLDWSGMDGIVVEGAPPVKAIPEYKVVGRSFPVPGIPAKVAGHAVWACDLELPSMLHARMIRPATLGSTLVSVGALDQARFPGARVVRKDNLLAVLSPNEWEAVSAARAVSTGARWSDWDGLPESNNLAGSLRARPWSAPDVTRGSESGVDAALASAARTISAGFEQPYIKHAPIGPYVAVADVRDGSAVIWSQIGHLQASRARLARILGFATEKVVVRWLDHAGQFGRKTFGGDGAEADAAILSQITGRPVRVQWSMEEDFAWSAFSPAWVADVHGGLDARGRLVAFRQTFRSPHMFDARPLGAILANLPAGKVHPGGFIDAVWPYDKVERRFEQVHTMDNLAAESAHGGLRGHIMRTPGQRQQTFVFESLVNQAAAAAKVDPLQYRMDHTTDARLSAVIRAAAKAASWQPRPSPDSAAQNRGSAPLKGRGVGVLVRSNAYWIGLAEISVVPATGVITVDRFVVAVDCGKIINPRQLDRCIKGGIVMGLGEALKEEVTFDRSRITSTDWSRYRIMTMQETPEILVVPLSRDDVGFGSGGEAPNALPPPAISAALFDATGVFPRRLPLTPSYVKALLASASA